MQAERLTLHSSRGVHKTALGAVLEPSALLMKWRGELEDGIALGASSETPSIAFARCELEDGSALGASSEAPSIAFARLVHSATNVSYTSDGLASAIICGRDPQLHSRRGWQALISHLGSWSSMAHARRDWWLRRRAQRYRQRPTDESPQSARSSALHAVLLPTAQERLCLTAFSRCRAELWVLHHSRRSGSCKERTKPATKPPNNAGTDVSVMCGQKRALDAPFKSATANPEAKRATVLGVSRTKVLRGVKSVVVAPGPWARFRKLNAAKFSAQLGHAALRASGRKPLAAPPLGLANLLICTIDASPHADASGRIRCLVAAAMAYSERPGFRFRSMPDKTHRVWV